MRNFQKSSLRSVPLARLSGRIPSGRRSTMCVLICDSLALPSAALREERKRQRREKRERARKKQKVLHLSLPFLSPSRSVSFSPLPLSLCCSNPQCGAALT